LIQYYVIKFVSDFRQVNGFLWVLRLSFTNKTDRHDITNIVESRIKHPNPLYFQRLLHQSYSYRLYTQQISFIYIIKETGIFMYYFIKRHDFLLLKFTGVFLNNALVVNVFLDIHVFIIKTKVLLSRG
jgi:hypothetical protein